MMKRSICAAVMAAIGLVSTGFATDYYWTATVADTSLANSGGKSGNSGAVTNWSVKAAGGYEVATQLPQGGDVVIFDNRLYTKAFAPVATFNDANKDTGLGGIVFTGTGYVKNSSWAIVWGDSTLYVSGSGFCSNAVSDTTGPMVWANLNVVGQGPGVVFGSVANGTYSQVRTVKGTAPVIVNGPGLVRLLEYNNDSNPNASHNPGNSTHCRNYSLQVPALILRSELDIRTWWKLTNTVVRFDADAAKLTVGWQQAGAGYHDLFLGNGSYVAETAANLSGMGSHSISAAADKTGTLHVKDTPGAAVQTFTGKLTGSASLDFDPTPSGYSFVFSRTASDTTGALIVSNGTVRLSDGATFTRLSGVTVAAGGTLKVDTGSGAGFVGGVLTLASGGTIDVGTGVSLVFSSGKMGGTAIADGIYTSANAAWVTGDGTVVVGSNVWPSDKTDIWNRNDFPAALPAGETWWRGISLSGESLDLTAVSGATAYLGPAGIVSAGSTTSENWLYKCYWPLKIVGNQEWNLGANDRLQLHAPLTTFAGGEIVISSSGGGGMSLMVPSPHLSHTIAISNGVVNVVANNALGRGPVYFDGINARFNLFGVTLDNPIFCTTNNGSVSKEYLHGLSNTTNVFNGLYTMPYGLNAYLKGDAGAHYVFRGGFTKPRGYIYIQSDTTVENVPIDMGVGAIELSNGATLTLGVANNKPGSNNFQLGSGQKLVTTVPYALNSAITGINLNMNVSGSGSTTFDMRGNDQSVTYLKGGPYSVVTSGVHAVLHTTTDSDYAEHNGKYTWSQTAYNGGVPTNYVYFAGGASLSVDGKGYMRICGYSSTTGTLTVAGGGLVEMAASQLYPPDGRTYKGMWPNASAVVVRKGTLDVQHSEAFGRDTVVKFEGTDGTIQLDAGVMLKVAALEIDGVAQTPGLYGGAASTARFKPKVDGSTYRFTGTGLLLVPGGGMTLVFR